MVDMYQVRFVLRAKTVRMRRPIFITVQADNASTAKTKAKAILLKDIPDADIKHSKATPVF